MPSIDHHASVPLGVLAPPPADTWALYRLDPPSELRSFVAWAWSVTWDLTGHDDHEQAALPYPSAHLVIEDGTAIVHGPTTRRFTRTLAGACRVVAIRFQPAGLRPFLDRPMTGLVDGRVPAQEVLPSITDDLVSRIEEIERPEEAMEELMVHVASMLTPLASDQRSRGVVDEVNAAVELIAGDRTLTTVAALADHTGWHRRTLQRNFAQYVGLSPKAVIGRYRIQDAAAAALNDAEVDWAVLARELGYYDQAHLVRDFTTTIGASPAAYARARLGNGGPG